MPTLYHRFTSVEALDQQYNVEASVDDFFGVYVKQFVEQSAIARETLNPSLDIAYGPTLSETLDVFPSASAAQGQLSPALFFVHGGYWKATTSKEWSYIAQGMSALGVVTVVENYALCPQVSVAEIVRQHRAAFAYVYRNAEHLGIDRQRMIIVGHSAGGHGVASLLATDWSSEYGLHEQPYLGAISVSGLFDLRPLPLTFVGPVLGMNDIQAEQLSPLLHLPARMPPHVVAYGTGETEEFIRQSVDYVAACQALGYPVTALALPANHFDILDHLADGNGALARAACALLGVASPQPGPSA